MSKKKGRKKKLDKIDEAILNEILPPLGLDFDRIEELKDQDGKDVGIVYRVTLSYVVTAICPCDNLEIADLVTGRIQAGDGVQESDIDKVEIIGVERI